jgi:plastocyanin
MRPSWTRFAVAALAILSAGCATTGSVAGKVDTPGRKKTSDQAVVTAARADSAKARHRNSPQAVLQFQDGQFTPSVLLVDPGTVLRVENRDRIWHNAFSVASNSPFDVGGIAPGKSATVRLDRAGVIKVFCEFHRKEVATIVVAPAKSRTRPMPDGNYQLGGLPAGTYEVSVWHPTYGTRTKLVAVAANERVTVNFRY